jgi:hypothetical protein
LLALGAGSDLGHDLFRNPRVKRLGLVFHVKPTSERERDEALMLALDAAASQADT